MEYYRFEDVFDALDLLGKQRDETGVNETYFTERNGFLVLEFDAVLFGTFCYGTVFFAGENKRADTVFVHAKELSFLACREQLQKCFGTPTSAWEEPYVAVNGGAVSACEFAVDGYQIRLSHASERNYIDLEFRLMK